MDSFVEYGTIHHVQSNKNKREEHEVKDRKEFVLYLLKYIGIEELH